MSAAARLALCRQVLTPSKSPSTKFRELYSLGVFWCSNFCTGFSDVEQVRPLNQFFIASIRLIKLESKLAI
jgi:hypothetical protein